MLVHCSAGVGRTGTFIVLDSMLERLEKEKTLNVYEFLTNMRRKRILMVQTKVLTMCSYSTVWLVIFMGAKFRYFMVDLVVTKILPLTLLHMETIRQGM